jgi:hypothetical protein
MKCKLFTVVFAVGFATTAFCQSLLGLTYPFGLPQRPNSGMSLTMGGAGSAVASENNVMLLNPANLGTIDRTVLSALYTFDFTRISESSVHSNFFSANPVQVSIGVPFGVVGTFGISLDVRSDRTAFYKDSSQLAYNGNSWWYEQGISSHGGILVWQAGWGRSLGKIAQVGISYERFYLFDEQTKVSQLSLPLVQLSNSRDSTTVSSSGNGVRAGVQIPVGALRIGISGEYFFSSAATATNALYANDNVTDTPVTNTASSASFYVRLPPSLTIGLSYDVSPEWLVAGDASAVFWRYATIGGPVSKPDSFTAVGVSLGAQYIPAPNILAPRYWETIRYRAGLRFSQLPSHDSYEYALTLGTGLPMGRGTGILDVALELGRRQSSQFAGYSEDFMSLAFGFNGGHKWVQSSRSTY